MLEKFFKHEAAGGIALMLAAIAALIIANSGLSTYYDLGLNSILSVTIAGEGLSKPLILWINDGLMAIFFFYIGLELKREMLEGKLKNPRDIMLPGLAAVGGMAVPAVLYAAVNWGEPSIVGWAIPAATDIAFALGLLALVGSRAPTGLKIFLLTLAILDDMGAILIIALFYTADLQTKYLLLSLIPLALMAWLNFRAVHRIGPIIILGLVLWVLVLKSGVHATLAGVVTAFFIPLNDRWGKSPLRSLEHMLHPWVSFFIIPVFAFANAGVVVAGLTLGDLFAPITLGIILGLVLGKQIGVLGLTWLVVKMNLAQLPYGVNWKHVYGVSALAGIGFTMSLFIGGLSFSEAADMNHVRLGVLVASLISGLIGFFVLFYAGNPENVDEPISDETPVQQPAQ
jgi:NhaA family Na+:H+ antiporter